MWNDQDRDHDSYSGYDSYRPGGSGEPVRFGFARPPVTPVVKVLLIAISAVFCLQFVFQAVSASAAAQMIELFGLSYARGVQKLHVWQFVSYLFLHGGLFHLLSNMLMLWMFGGDVEMALGRRKFTQLFFLGGAVAGIAYVCWGAFDSGFVPAVGASGSLMAILVVFAMRHPNRTVLLFFLIPLKVWQVVALIIGIDLYYFVLNDQNGVANTAHLGGALFGYVWYKYSPRFDSFVANAERNQRIKERRNEDDARAEVDRLLEKIGKEGMQSLTSKERRFLKQASRRFYDSD